MSNSLCGTRPLWSVASPRASSFVEFTFPKANGVTNSKTFCPQWDPLGESLFLFYDSLKNIIVLPWASLFVVRVSNGGQFC